MLSDNGMITLSNYEEYFVLYVDNELEAPAKAAVEAFVARHPQLAGELDALMNAKLLPDEVSFAGKEELFSQVMKLNNVDETLLLYIDDELPAAEKESVENRIAADKDYARQHSLLAQTKLNANATVSHPNKKELYRHEKRVVPFAFWIRTAAAVVLLLLGTWFLVLNKGSRPEESITAGKQPVKNNPVVSERPAGVEKGTQKKAVTKEDFALMNGAVNSPLKDIKTIKRKVRNNGQDNASSTENTVANHRSNVVRLEAARFTIKPNVTPAIAVNKTITPASVTSQPDASYKEQNSPINNPEVAWAEEKKTPARGFFRKVSRFIERKAGIGTANADNELLVGVVAVKLK